MILLVGLLCLELSSAELKIVPCKGMGKTASSLKKIEINECTKYPCVFRRGQKYTIKAEFQSHQKLTDLKLNIVGTVNNKNVPFHTNDDNHCTETIKELKGSQKCVINRKGNYNYEFSLDVLKSYPALNVYVNYMVKSNDKPVFCFTFPAKLV